MNGHLLYAAAWISFAAGHSALADPGLKNRLRPLFGPYYRLSYNLFALLSISLVIAVGWLVVDSAVLTRPSWLTGVMRLAYWTGWVVLLAALAGYDLGRFSGITQILDHRANRDSPADEPLRTDGLNRFVRHPLYSGAWLILLGRIDSGLDAATAFWGCLYLFAGMLFEERKLLAVYGDAYHRYRRRVPALVPWKGGAG